METQTRHTYEYTVDLNSRTAPTFVAELTGSHKRVLEIGCGPGSITRILALQGQCQVTGIELDTSAIEKAAPYCEQIFQADLNAPEWLSLVEAMNPFDVVVAADVLEHLYDPWVTLKRMATLIGPEGYLVISLPHVGHAAVVSCLLNSDFEYRDWGLLDRTHIRFFGLRNIENLFAQAGLKIIDVRYVTKTPEETEFATSWGQLAGTLQKVLKDREYANIYQVVVKAVPLDYPGTALSLTKAPQHAVSHGISWKHRISRHLSQKTKQRIRTSLGFFNIRI
jgi:2-polyprenyl-3-methyl-5-hydroxy-6-metoxy-1,4-benzoquinol methylase